MKSKITWVPITREEDLGDLIINSPIGPFRANSPQSPTNALNFEIMNTNFKITNEMVQRLNRTVGIESLVCISPYQTICSIGKLFDREKVKTNVELQLVGRILNCNLEIANIPESILEKVKSPAMLFPNGESVPLDEENEEV